MIFYIVYRADFRSTMSETCAPNGEWKFTLGFVLGCFGVSVWLYMFVRGLSKLYFIFQAKDFKLLMIIILSKSTIIQDQLLPH